MGKYGSGLTYSQIANMEKEEIKHALHGEKFAGTDSDGNFMWESCSKEETSKIILEAYDESVFQCLNAMSSGRALEHIAREHGYEGNLSEYQKALTDTYIESEYKFEKDVEE